MLISNFGIIANSGGVVLTAVDYANLLAAGDNTYVNDDTANSLIANDSVACAIIRGSAMAVSLLDASTIVTVPTMTSNNAPDGVTSASSEYSAVYMAWKAFDGNNATLWISATNLAQWIQYQFALNVWCYKIAIRPIAQDNRYFNNVKVQYSDDGIIWNDATSTLSVNYSVTDQFFNVAFHSGKVAYWRLYCGDAVADIGGIYTMQFFCKTY